jgi:DNA integrity scanning protein DisA with diadenylate cyclase activity
MGEELKDIKEDIREIKDGIREIRCEVSNLRVLIAGDYVTKNEFMAEMQKNSHTHMNFTNSLIFISISLLTVFGYFLINGLR